MDERLAQALIQAAQARTDFSGSPNQTAANAGQMTNLQNLAQIGMGDARTDVAAGAFGGATDATVSRQDTERDAAARMADILAKREVAQMEQNEAEKLRQQELDSPENYQRVIAEDGGYRFLTGRGQEVDAMEYARKTNQRITDVLKGSENPHDQEYVKGYESIRDLNFALKSSEEDEKKFFDKNPGIAGQFNTLVNEGLSREEALRTMTEAFGKSFHQKDERTVRGLTESTGNVNSPETQIRPTRFDKDGNRDDDRWFTPWW